MSLSFRGARLSIFLSLLFSLLATFTPCLEAQTNFGTVTQGSSAKLAVTLSIPATGSFSTISVVTQGAPNLDFTNAGGGTCVAGSSYTAGAACTVEVTFSPKHAGTRYGAVVLSNAAGVVATAYLQGTGSGTLSQTVPGSVLQPFTLSDSASSVAVDAGGDVFVSACGGSAAYSGLFKETPASGGGYTQSTLGGAWVCPGPIALDGAGNLYVFDQPGTSLPTLYELTPVGGTYLQNAILSGFSIASGLAVDGAGNLYVADRGENAVDKETFAGGVYTKSLIGSGWGTLQGIAVDGAGKVYIANQPATGGEAVAIETPSGSGYTQNTTAIDAANFSNIGGLAVDGTGNVYVVDQEDLQYGSPSNVYRETPSGNGYSASAFGSTWVAPTGLTVDGSGNIFVLDSLPGGSAAQSVFEVYTGTTAPTTMTVTANPSSPTWGTDVTITASVNAAGNKPVTAGSVVFNDGTSDVATVNLSATGTASWTASGNTYGAYGSQQPNVFSASFTGSETYGPSSGSVDVSWSFPQCPITFSPVAGTYTGSVTVTVNAGPCIISGQGSSQNPSEETFTLTSTQTISVTAGANGYDNTTATATYTIVPATAATGTISTVAGDGVAGYSGDSGAATSAELSRPFGVVSDSAGNLYVADTFNSRVRKVTPAGTITTFAGTGVAGSSGDGGAATSAELYYPQTLAFDAAGNLYLADPPTNKVRKVTPAGTISTYAGTGVAGHSGDGGAATSAELNYPAGVAVDTLGNVYIAEANNEDIRKVTPAGTITTIAGTGTRGYAGDGGAATSAEFAQPGGLAFDSAGNLYLADQSNNRIRKITPSGTISTVAGNGTSGYGGDGGAATSAELNAPLGVAVDSAGNLYIADLSNSRVRKVNASGTISTLAGTGAQGFSGDGGPAASAVLYDPFGLGVDGAGNVYIADTDNNRVRKLTLSSANAAAATPVFSPAGGTYTSAQTVTITDATAGATIYYTTNGTLPSTSSTKYTGAIAVSSSETIEAIAVANGYANSAVATAAYTITPSVATPTFSPAGGTYTSAQTVTISDATAGATIYYTTNGTVPTTSSTKYTGAITVSATETLEAIAVAAGYTNSAAATATYTISAATASGTITTVAGNGTGGYSGNGGAATSAELNGPAAVSTDASGNFYIADYGSNTIRKVTVSTGIIATVAGDDVQGYGGDGGAATGAEFYGPQYAAEDAAGNLYIADQVNCRIRKVTAATSVVSTVAGNGSCGFAGDGGAATGAEIFDPYGVAVDASGNLYIADTYNHRIRKVTVNGTISTIAGTGTGGYNGDNMAATSAELYYPWGVSVDASGNLYIADWYNNRVRKVTAGGTITTLAGTGGAGSFGGDGGPASSAGLNSPQGVWADAAGDVYIADTANQRIRKVNASGIISTVAGNGTKGFSGDGGLATGAELNTPQSVASDAAGNVYIADIGNQRIRKVSGASTTATAATPVFSPAGGTYTSAQTVTITDATAGSTIYYTTNGTTPTASSTKYTGAIAVSATETLEAIAVASGYTNSAVATAAYTITPPAATPVFSLPGGTYTGAVSLTISDATPGATIYYTTNGTTPTASSTKYTGAIAIPATPGLTETVEAIAVAAGYTSSPVATAVYTITPPAATPVISPASGTYTTAQTVTITDATAGATIYYTTNGSVPTTSSTKYTGPITVPATPGLLETIEAKAIAPGYSLSQPVVAAYTMTPPAAAPAFSLASGTYTGAQTVTITDSTAGATIYYTTNGTSPTTASTKYTGAITVSSTETLEAIAVATGYTNSAVATATYTLQAATPVFSVAPGIYPAGQLVTLTDATAGAAIYYTTDGSVPSAASKLYAGPVLVGASETLQAIAVLSGEANSAVASAAYTIIGSPAALALPASSITTTSATLNATVNPLGLAGSYSFSWGTSATSLSASTPATPLAAVSGNVAAAAALSGLTTKTTYFYRVTVTTTGGTTSGAILSFTTN